jgi:LysB family phage lysis regulatory protein
MMYVYIAIALFLVAAGGTVVWKYNHAIERAVEAEQRAATAEEGLKAYEKSYNYLLAQHKKLDATLTAKTKSDIKIRQELNNVQAQLEELKRKDPTVMEWANEPVPPAVIDFLRVKPDAPADKGNGSGTGAKGSDVSNTGSAGGGITIKPN